MADNPIHSYPLLMAKTIILQCIGEYEQTAVDLQLSFLPEKVAGDEHARQEAQDESQHQE